jgi:ribonuclease HI
MTFVYAVKKGLVPGVYKTWSDCVQQVNGYPGAVYKKFDNINEAISFVNTNKIKQIEGKNEIKDKTEIKNINNEYSIIKYLTANRKKKEIQESIQEKVDDYKNNIYIFCDGSAIHKKYKSIRCGYGVFIKLPNDKTIEHSEELISSGTNNLAELSAILYGMNQIEKIFSDNDNINQETDIYFVCDSKYAINCVLVWSINWKQNNWKTTKGTEVENVELIKNIIKKYDELMTKGYKIKFKHINSHQTKPADHNTYQYLLWHGNDMADKLAKNGKIID